jgi:hypothetical protein
MSALRSKMSVVRPKMSVVRPRMSAVGQIRKSATVQPMTKSLDAQQIDEVVRFLASQKVTSCSVSSTVTTTLSQRYNYCHRKHKFFICNFRVKLISTYRVGITVVISTTT